MLPPCVGMMSVSTALTSDEIVRVSVVSGVTVNACVENTTSAVWPAARRSSKSSSLSFARASRDGSTSPASIERDRSSATTSASSERNAGTGSRSHVGPASATIATQHAASAAHERASGCRAAPRARRARAAATSRRRRCANRRVGAAAQELPDQPGATGSSSQPQRPQEVKLSHGEARSALAADRAARPLPARRGQRTQSAAPSAMHDGGAERPMEQLGDRAEAALVGLGGLELVEDLVDLRELARVARAKIAAARQLGDRGQRLLVEIGRRIDLAQAEQRAHGQRVGADADRVDDHLALRRELGGLARLDGARRVGAVRQEQQHAPALLDAGVLERADREADRVADRRLLAGEADDGLVEQRAARSRDRTSAAPADTLRGRTGSSRRGRRRAAR